MIIAISYGSEFGGHEKASIDVLLEVSRHTTYTILVDRENQLFIDYCKIKNINFIVYDTTIDILHFIFSSKGKRHVLQLCGNLFVGTLVAVLLNLLLIRPSVYIPYYLDYTKFNKFLGGSLRNIVQFFSISLYKSVITISESSRKAILSRTNIRRVYVYTNRYVSVEIDKNNNYKKDYDVLIIGRIYFKQKGQDRAIEFLEDYAKKYNKRLRVAIAGRGADERKLEILLSKSLHNIYDNLGFVKDTGRLYKGSKVILLASHFEGVPLVLLEALAHRSQVLASNIDVFRSSLPHKHLIDFHCSDHEILNTVLNSNDERFALKKVEYVPKNEIVNFLTYDCFR